MNIHVEKTEMLAQKAAEALNTKLGEIKGRPTLLLLSGGSALAILNFLNPELVDANTTLSVFDNRYSSNSQENNFLLLSETDFFKKAVVRGAHYIDTTLQSGVSLIAFGRHFEEGISKWLSENPLGTVIATMGVGPDGHTGGIMPFPEDPELFEELFESESLAIGYNAGKKNPFGDRITVTMTFIKQYLDYAVVYMSGENKINSLEKINSSEGTLAEAPCRVLREIPNVELFTDILN